MGYSATCTVRANRMEKCPLEEESVLKKQGRGSMDFWKDEEKGVLIVKWYDNKEVRVASNHFSAEPTELVSRYDKKEKKRILISRPALISAYNYGMGGVDRCDQLLSFYRIKTKSVKWYKRILFHFLDLSLVNAYILRKTKSFIPLFQFKLNVALTLMKGGTLIDPLSQAAVLLMRNDIRVASNGEPLGPALVPDGVRLDGYNHFPQNVSKDGKRCKLKGCNQRSAVWCTKCRVYLCVKKGRDCFILFHTQV